MVVAKRSKYWLVPSSREKKKKYSRNSSNIIQQISYIAAKDTQETGKPEKCLNHPLVPSAGISSKSHPIQIFTATYVTSKLLRG